MQSRVSQWLNDLGWGSAQLRDVLQRTRPGVNFEAQPGDQAILDWIHGEGPTPARLQQEMIHDGFPDLTPDTVRNFFNGTHVPPPEVLQRIKEWLWGTHHG
ncbi:hypothetical protein G3N95_03815 [Paraburkholderia sp. Tr-20389]|uniref:hypothetical protein n=1 Tax=Paraburkholderia sp. Tr-20389 TaxID=2703903 RepID=UPI00197CE04B|nr:hypothetical protein [Paraburkholderia sp. Tr-20389]MBN3752054.1 hypothetical protein [Paraburkholderia sp. Tr-20389]